MYNMSQCSAIMPLIEQRCNGEALDWQVYRMDERIKEGRIRLKSLDGEREGR